MKQLFVLMLLLGLTLQVQAQAPGKFKYQAVARNTNNQPYANTTLRIRFALLENNATGTVRYLEEQTVTTSSLGVFEANIGGGTVIQGSLNNVFLGEHAYFLRVELNTQSTGGTFILMGTSQLLSVPYALYSAQAGSGGDQTLDLSGNELSISNGNSVTLPEYEAGPGIQISGNQIYALDESDTNELQYLDINGQELSLSNGNSVILPANGFSLPYAGAEPSSGPLFSITNTSSGAAIYAVNYGGGEAAIVGEDPTGGYAGVRGYSTSSYGVLGYSDSGYGVLGQSGNGVGVAAQSNGGTALEATSNGGTAIRTQGKMDLNGDADLNGYLEVHGNAKIVGSGYTLECSGGHTAVLALSSGTGLYAAAADYGVLSNASSSGYAGYFLGKLYGQTLEKGSGSFKIDHPLDPENKYLYHSFVESPDMMNVYNGNAITDANGVAVVELPDYFEALNRDFRYQLTCIGTFAQLIISREVSHNTFEIRSDKPNVKVSWQVTGIRQDAHANKFRIVPTVEKAAKAKGKYLCPECFNLPEERGIMYETMYLDDSKRK